MKSNTSAAPSARAVELLDGLELSADWRRKQALRGASEERRARLSAELKDVSADIDALQSVRTRLTLALQLIDSAAAIGERPGPVPEDMIGACERYRRDLQQQMEQYREKPPSPEITACLGRLTDEARSINSFGKYADVGARIELGRARLGLTGEARTVQPGEFLRARMPDARMAAPAIPGGPETDGEGGEA